METKRVIIVGAGIGGLCTAIALQQYGFEVTVYEKVKKLGEVGAGLTLWSNALKVLRFLGLAGQAIGAGSKLTHSQLLVLCQTSSSYLKIVGLTLTRTL